MNFPYLTGISERVVAPLYATVPATIIRFHISVGHFLEHVLVKSWISSIFFIVSIFFFRGNKAESFSIEGRNLRFSFTTKQTQDVPVLRDCSIRIPCGQFWMLLGPNGCGKSTLLKVVSEFRSERYCL